MSLTEQERAEAQRIGFSERTFVVVKEATGAEVLDTIAREEQVEDLDNVDGTRKTGRTLHALIATTARETSEDVLIGLRRELLPAGYLPFLIDRTFPFQDRPDVIAVLPDTDPLAPVRFCGTDAGNYDRSHYDILRTLEGWRSRFEYDVLGAEHDSIYLRLHTLPEDMAAFAAELYDFCPDLIDQGIGCFVEEGAEFLNEEQRTDIEGRFAADTGDEEGKAQRVALQILAETIESSRRLALWWD